MKKIISIFAIGLILIGIDCGKLPQKDPRVIAAGNLWYCQTICEGGVGGNSRLVKDVCYCSIKDPIDDGDRELIDNTAKTIGMVIKFEATSSKRSTDDFNINPDKTSSNKDGDNDNDKGDKDDKVVENNTKQQKVKSTLSPKKFTLKPLKPMLADLRARFGKLDGSDVIEEEPLLGQIDPQLEDTEPHHNIYTPFGAHKFAPILGQINPSIKEIEPHHNVQVGGYGGFGGHGGYPVQLTPALTRSLLMSVREKLDNLLRRTVQMPYQPAVTAHETESMRNTLKQITQVNVNVRPHGTTWGYIFNNLVNQLAPALRGLVGQEAPNGTSGEIIEMDEDLQKTTVATKLKHGKHGKSKAKQLGKKKVTTIKSVIDEATEAISSLSINPTEEIIVGITKQGSEDLINIKEDFNDKPYDTKKESNIKQEGSNINDDGIKQEVSELSKNITTEKSMIMLSNINSTASTISGTTLKFLPEEEGDDLIGNMHEDYYYHHEDGNGDDNAEPLPVPLA